MANPTASDQYILFLDLLGFKNIVNAWDANGCKGLLIELVRYISTAQSTYSASITAGGETVTLRMRPAITTFSDCIVISYPTTPPVDTASEFAESLSGAWRGEVLRHMALLAALISERSLPLQLLLRGGLCRGVLVHEDRYIIGPGLNEAYRLESRIADVPRIVVSEEIYADDPNLFSGILLKDSDGRSLLDYMPKLTEQIGARFDAAVWREIRLQEIDSNINDAPVVVRSDCCDRKPSNIPEKWTWFRKYFDQGTKALRAD